MPKLVRGDSARVVQIFANLISNSIKFTTSKFNNCTANFPRFYHAYQKTVIEQGTNSSHYDQITMCIQHRLA
jgi:signal transduction histidine kinase